MKILFVGEALSGFGGTETVIKKLTHFIESDPVEQNQYQIYFLCRNNKMDMTWLEGMNTDFVYGKCKISYFRKLKYVCSLTKYIKKYSPDIVISFDITTCELASKALKKSGLSIPLISWVHYSLEHKKRPECVLFADYHMAISSGIKTQLINRGVSADKVFTIYNPVSPTSDVIPRPNESEPKSFIYLGRMKFEGQKRLKDMLDTFAKVEGNWILHMIGNGSDYEQCQEYAKQLGIADKVKWHGWQQAPWDYIQNEIKRISAFVMTSKFEGLPMTLLEAMSYGIYCVSSDCPSGPGDIIQDEVNGKLYAIGRLDVLEQELINIVNGKVLPSASQIKESIHSFYDETYYDNVKQCLKQCINQALKTN